MARGKHAAGRHAATSRHAAPRSRVRRRRRSPFRHFLVVYGAVWLVLTGLAMAAVYAGALHYQRAYDAEKVRLDPARYMESQLGLFSADQIYATYQQYAAADAAAPAMAGDVAAAVRALSADRQLACTEDAASRTLSPVYDITADGARIATVTLRAKSTDSFGLHEWEIHACAFDLSGTAVYPVIFLAPRGAAVTVDGTAIGSANVTGSTAPQPGLVRRDGLTAPADACYDTYSVSCFSASPVITVTQNGTALQPLAAADGTAVYCGSFMPQADIDALNSRVDDFLETYIRFMYHESELSAILPYTEPGSQAASALKNVAYDLTWSYPPRARETLDARRYNYVWYDADTFGVTSYVQLQVTRGTTYEDTLRCDWLFVRGSDGVWYLSDFTIGS